MAFGRAILICIVVLWTTFFGPATWALAPSYDIAVRDLFPLVVGRNNLGLPMAGTAENLSR